jgi:uncharacterized protein
MIVCEFKQDSVERLEPGQHGYFYLPVTNNLVGQEVFLPIHIIKGLEPGPRLGAVSVIHGNEPPPIRVLARLLRETDPAKLKGMLVMIPVANPFAFAHGTRNTPETDLHFTDLNRVFPGTRGKAVPTAEGLVLKGTVTEMMAALLAERVFPFLDYLLDFHCHHEGCGMAEVMVSAGEDPVRKRSMDLSRSFGWGLIHEIASPEKSISGYAAASGIPSFEPTLGGAGLGPLEETFVDIQTRGVLNVMNSLGMVQGLRRPYSKRAFVYSSWTGIRPMRSGYLLSDYHPGRLFAGDGIGLKVEQGQVLGRILDPYSLEIVEEMKAPESGYLCLTRNSGVIQAGSHAYGVAPLTSGRWENLS